MEFQIHEWKSSESIQIEVDSADVDLAQSRRNPKLLDEFMKLENSLWNSYDYFVAYPGETFLGRVHANSALNEQNRRRELVSYFLDDVRTWDEGALAVEISKRSRQLRCINELNHLYASSYRAREKRFLEDLIDDLEGLRGTRSTVEVELRRAADKLQSIVEIQQAKAQKKQECPPELWPLVDKVYRQAEDRLKERL